MHLIVPDQKNIVKNNKHDLVAIPIINVDKIFSSPMTNDKFDINLVQINCFSNYSY